VPLLREKPPGHRALRRHRISIPGQVYLVTFVTHRRVRWFDDVLAARCACHSLTDARNWEESRLLAWVLMPDHWHGLVELGERQSLARLVNRVKSHSVRIVRRDGGVAERIWGDGFHDHALRSDEALVDAARYLVLNPFRAGLVRRIGDYPYWDAIWVERNAAGGPQGPNR
jgi:putative transposase